MTTLGQLRFRRIPKPRQWGSDKERYQWIQGQAERLGGLLSAIPLLARISAEQVDLQHISELVCKTINLAEELCVFTTGELPFEQKLREGIVNRLKSRCPCVIEIVSGPIVTVNENDPIRAIPLFQELRSLPSDVLDRVTIRIALQRPTTHFAFCDGQQACYYLEHHITPSLLRRPRFLYEGDKEKEYDQHKQELRDEARNEILRLWAYIKKRSDQFVPFTSYLPTERHFLRLTKAERDILEEELLQYGVFISNFTAQEILERAEGFQDNNLRKALLHLREEYQVPACE